MTNEEPKRAGWPSRQVQERGVDALGGRVRQDARHDEIILSHDQVEAERRRYRELFDLAPDGYLVTDVAGAIQDANVAAGSLLGSHASRLAGTPIISWVVEPSRGEFRKLLLLVAERRHPATIHMAFRSSGSTVKDVEAVVAPVLGPEGACVGMRWMLREVSEQRAVGRGKGRLSTNLEQKVAERTADLRQAAAELETMCAATAATSGRKSDFMAYLSHEIRTPLQALIGYSDVLMMELHGPLTDAQRGDLARMQCGQQHILRLVEQLLDHSRIEAGR